MRGRDDSIQFNFNFNKCQHPHRTDRTARLPCHLYSPTWSNITVPAGRNIRFACGSSRALEMRSGDDVETENMEVRAARPWINWSVGLVAMTCEVRVSSE